MKDGITWVGLDAHKATIQVAMVLPGRDVAVEWQVTNEPAAVKRLARKVQRTAPAKFAAAMRRHCRIPSGRRRRSRASLEIRYPVSTNRRRKPLLHMGPESFLSWTSAGSTPVARSRENPRRHRGFLRLGR